MNKKYLSTAVITAITTSCIVLPVNAQNENVVKITYVPDNYVIRYGSAWSHTGRQEIAVNTVPAAIRTDQDELMSQYVIVAPEAIENITINIDELPLKLKQSDSEAALEEAIMGMSLYYSTTKDYDIPNDGEYYLYTDEETGEAAAVGGTVEEVTTLLDNTWRNNLFLHDGAEILIDKIMPSTFGVTDADLTSKTYDVSYNITDIVKEDLVSSENEQDQAKLSILYSPSNTYGIWAKGTDYCANPAHNWAEDTELYVEYNIAKLEEIINEYQTSEDLIKKIKQFAPFFGCSESDFNNNVLIQKVPNYTGTIFTVESFNEMINNIKTVDITAYQLDITDKFNYSNWGKLNEEITTDTFIGDAISGNFIFPETGSQIDSFTLIATDVVTTVNEDGTETKTNVENGDVIEFKFDPDTYSANVNNVYNDEPNAIFSFEGFKNYAKRIYIAASSRYNHRNELYPVVTYTDGTKETKAFTVLNIGQTGYDSVLGYSGAMEMSKSVLGNNTWTQAVKSTQTNENGNYYVTSAPSSGGIGFYSFDVDPTKTIANITLSNSASTTLNVYAVGQTVMSNSELFENIQETEKLSNVTADNAQQVLISYRYAQELLERNAATADDFAKLNELYEQANWYSEMTDSEQMQIDISEQLNIDCLMPLGSQVSEPWNTGYSWTYTPGWTENASLKNAVSTYSNGIRSVNEVEYVLNEDGETYSLRETGRVVNFSTPPERLEQGVKDAWSMKPGDEPVTVNASGKCVDKLYVMWSGSGSSQNPYITVNYKDGTSETVNVFISGFGWGFVNDSDILNRVYPALAGGMFLSYNSYQTIKNENDDYYTVSGKTDVYGGVNVYSVKLDSTKEVESYTFGPDINYETVIHAVTEVTMDNDAMKKVIAQAKELEHISTQEDAELAETAYCYAKELDRRHAVRYADNAWLDDLITQAKAQNNIYLDLSELQDADLMISIEEGNNTRPADYTGRDDFLYRGMPQYIEMSAPTNPDHLDSETGAKFMLSGAYNTNGNDSVTIYKNGSDVEFNMDGKMLSHVSFLIDCIDQSVSADTGAVGTAVINFTDGTAKEVNITISRGDSWYSGQKRAHYIINYAHYDSETGKYADGKLSDRTDSTGAFLTAFGIDIPEKKTVSSITLKASEICTYSILAVTAIPVQNDELINKLYDFLDMGLVDADEVTAQNAPEVIEGVNAIEELYKRRYTLITEDDLNAYLPLRDAAYAYSVEDDVLKFTPSITVGQSTVTAGLSMINTTQENKNYVLIIAAYDSNNQLVGLNATEQKVLGSMTYNGSDSISINIPENAATYKAMVWESIDGMNPIAIISK